MRKKDAISIIMGVYNCEKYLKNAIESILDQDYKRWELIICDDASTDNTYKIARAYANKYPRKIILIRNNTNLGLNKTLNKCLLYATGDYIARQDGDDISDRHRLSKQINFLKTNTNYALVSSNMIFFDGDDEWGRTRNKSRPNKNDFMDGNPFAHGPCMTYRKIYEELGGYSTDKSTLRVEDYDLWARMYKNGHEGYVLQECLYKMRNDKDAIKRRTFKNRINEVKLKKRIYKMFGIEKKYYYKIYLPLVKFFTPRFIYNKYYKRRYYDDKAAKN